MYNTLTTTHPQPNGDWTTTIMAVAFLLVLVTSFLFPSVAATWARLLASHSRAMREFYRHVVSGMKAYGSAFSTQEAPDVRA